LIQLLERHRQHFGQSPATAKALIETGIAPVSSPASASELAAWTSVCRVLLNLHETITRY
jgi:hypothetical protein